MAVLDGAAKHEALRALTTRVRPVTTADRQVLAVPTVFEPLLPEGGLRRGSTVAVEGPAATSLTLALVAEASGQGSWVVFVGMPTIGLVAASELGVALDRVALVDPPPGTWASTLAALVDAVDLVVVGAGSARAGRLRPSDVRRLTSRVRERGAVMILSSSSTVGAWPEVPDLTIASTGGRWEGIGDGHGHLRARRVGVEASGRRGAARPRSLELWLPSTAGGVAAVDHPAGRTRDAADPQVSPARLRPVG